MSKKIRFVIETQAGRLWGPFNSAASAQKYGAYNLRRDGKILNAYKIRPLHSSR